MAQPLAKGLGGPVLAAGALFGSVWAVVYTVVGSDLGSSLAYLVGRTFGGNLQAGKGIGGIGNYAEPMRENSFETVFVMRLLFLPYDLVI